MRALRWTMVAVLTAVLAGWALLGSSATAGALPPGIYATRVVVKDSALLSTGSLPNGAPLLVPNLTGVRAEVQLADGGFLNHGSLIQFVSNGQKVCTTRPASIFGGDGVCKVGTNLNGLIQVLLGHPIEAIYPGFTTPGQTFLPSRAIVPVITPPAPPTP